MDELARQVAGLRLKFRLQMLSLTGILIAGLLALGARDGVARNATASGAPPSLVLAALATTAVESDAWRLVYSSPTAIALHGLGRNGGTININGTSHSFPTDVVLTPPPVSGAQVYAYAAVVGTAVTLEISTTAPTANQTGTYASKTGDPTRRYVGMAYTDGTGHFTPDLLRSVLNELGYAFTKKIAPATPNESLTSQTDWTALVGGGWMQGLFFEGERVRYWVRAMNYVAPSFTTRDCHLGVMWIGGPSTADDSESVAMIDRGTAWADPFSVQTAEAYYMIPNSGIQTFQAVHKGDASAASDFYISASTPLTLGFELVR